jgi:antitoxin (DNA-binding transcriptional repressor) of toxin-antitoxin stability system
MEKVYSPIDAQQHLLELLRQVHAGKAVKIASSQQPDDGAILMSEVQWAAIQAQLVQATQTHETQHRQDLYKAWRWL